MAIDERSRHALYLRLEHVLGRDEAETLMEHLPPVGWADVATRRDLDVLRTELTAEITSLRSELGSEIASLRSELTVEITSVRTEMTSDTEGLRADIGSLRSEMRAMELSLTGLFRMELAQAVTAQTRTMVITMITLFVTAVSLAFAAARLGDRAGRHAVCQTERMFGIHEGWRAPRLGCCPGVTGRRGPRWPMSPGGPGRSAARTSGLIAVPGPLGDLIPERGLRARVGGRRRRRSAAPGRARWPSPSPPRSPRWGSGPPRSTSTAASAVAPRPRPGSRSTASPWSVRPGKAVRRPPTAGPRWWRPCSTG